MCWLGHNNKQRPGSMCSFAQWYTSSWKNRYPVCVHMCVFCMSLCIFMYMYMWFYPTDPKKKSQISKAAPSKKKASLCKSEGDRKRVGRKASTVVCTNKKPGNLVHTIIFMNAFFSTCPLCSLGAEDRPALTVLHRLKRAAVCPWCSAAPCCWCCHWLRSEARRDLSDTSGVCSATQLSFK